MKTLIIYIIGIIVILNIFYFFLLTKINSTKHDNNVEKRNRESLYIVDSSKCQIPRINPFASDIMDLYEMQMPMLFESCTNESDLIIVTYNATIKRYILNIDLDVADILSDFSDSAFVCYYTEIKRNANTDHYTFIPRPQYFTQDYIVPYHIRGLVVKCHYENNINTVLQEDAFSLIQYLDSPTNVTPFRAMQTPPRKASVIILGIDSLSSNNLYRTMPKVHKFLHRSGWYELQGYNKVGDNTLPNLMAILSGFTPKTAEKHLCDVQEKGCFDRIPFIWKYFKNASYITALGEDMSKISTFNYLKCGFREQPTDYYLRPNLAAFEDMLGMTSCKHPSIECCIGRRIISSYVYDFCLEFVRRYIRDRPLFGLFWVNSFSHDNFAMPTKMQTYLLEYLYALEIEDVFEESIVIFMSDHGARFGKIHYLPDAFLEERLPMMYIYLPPWFRVQYPEFAKSLKANQNRLTSNYDLHNTLMHIIELGGIPDGQKLPKANDCSTCQSLFYPISEQRSCVDAGIPEHFCTCEPFKVIKDNWTTRIPSRVIDRINKYLDMKNLSSICHHLSLKNSKRVGIKIGLDINFYKLPTMDVAIYRTDFVVNENNAAFSATVEFNNITEHIDVDVETISRTNSYKNDAKCIDDKKSQLYCICK